MSYVLGSEHWENFKSLLFLVKEYVYCGRMGSKITKYCMAMTHALVIFNPSPQLGIWGVSRELMGKGVVSWTNEVNLTI